MSLLALPDETILAIIAASLDVQSYRGEPIQPFVFMLTLLSRRFYRLTLPILYERPDIRGFQNVKDFLHTIRNREELASSIKTLKVDFHNGVRDSEALRWNEKIAPMLRLPVLSNCKDLAVDPMRNYNKPSYRTDSPQLLFPIEEIFRWVANCPRLRTIGIDSLSPETEPPLSFPSSLSDIGVDVPTSLSELYLSEVELTPQQTSSLWRICTPWMKTLKILHVLEESKPHMDDMHLLSGCLRTLDIFGGYSDWDLNQDDKIHREIPIRMPFLETLRYYLPMDASFTTTYPNFRTLAIELPQLTGFDDSDVWSGSVESLAVAMQGPIFPVLQFLTIWHKILCLDLHESGWSLIVEHKVDRICADRRIAFDYLLGRPRDPSFFQDILPRRI